MSTTVHSPEVDISAYRKRGRDRQDDPLVEKRPRRYYFRLESESSRCSEEDTESVHSIQDQETDIVRDTSDTESKSEDDSNEEYDVEIEYEVASLSDDDQGYQFSNTSSGEEDIVLAAVEAICDRSLEAWVTDGEESDSTSEDENSLDRSGFSMCVQCKSPNDHPLYRYCEKCFQSCRQCKKRKAYKCFPFCNSCYKDRKKFFPPRPRRQRRPLKRLGLQPPQPVKIDVLRSCLSGLSQDSGIGSSQECATLDLNLDQIIVPTSWSSSLDNELATVSCSSLSSSSDLGSESSAPELEKIEITKPSVSTEEPSPRLKQDKSETKKDGNQGAENTTSELCMFCNNAPKDSIFLHTNIGHRCCCYKCAKRTLHTTKRCPICNRAVQKVIRVYTA